MTRAAQLGITNAVSPSYDTYSHVMPQEEIPVETWLRLIARAERVPTEKARVTR